ncbi:hypothetical protein S7335_1935 [Synechococcus sp. PCC 7335]|uniref:hypothetical protein n=1 Tax=Synechococcus sp. (strain ATCC 29403 / PCC 7335) TaxID=91464 RepID=UPI00017ECEAE|nr:hypothetical protein [Synechococcus sp. PCC 7335]EDX84238.1 hypothetical protein S7335_1935 [Synechococcus sp. PCC 7335]
MVLVNRDRLMQSIVDVAPIGKLSSSGVQQTAFDQVDRDQVDCCARALGERWIRRAGMRVRLNLAGNIFGPSESGVGSAVNEYAYPNDCAHSTNVLCHTLARSRPTLSLLLSS